MGCCSGEKMEQFLTECSQRSAVYRMCSAVFWRELSEEQIRALSQMPWAIEGDGPMVEGALRISSYLSRANRNTRQELAVDYSRIFLAAGNNEDRMAIPFESVFSSESGLLMQEARDEVCRMMYGERFEPDPDLHCPEDHISFEMEFMAVLADKGADALRQGDEVEAKRLMRVQQEFLEQHLASWTGDLFDAMRTYAQTDFYRGFASLVEGWLDEDTAYLKEASTTL